MATSHTQPVSVVGSDVATGLPVLALATLAMTGFVSIMTETMPAGLLPQISAGLGVPPALSGQLEGWQGIVTNTARSSLTD